MLLVLCAATISAAVVWTGLAVARELREWRADAVRHRSLGLLTLFAPGAAAATEEPRALLSWQPLAVAARTLFPEEFVALDRASGDTFPFSSEQLQAAHSRWTAAWLAWEHSHDAEFKLKTAAAERDMLTPGSGHLERAKLESIEREKLELYQRRYEEYIRVAKALQALQRGPVAS